MRKNRKNEIVDKTIVDPTEDDGFEGMFFGTPEMGDDYVPYPFDLHAAAQYVREHDLPGIDEEIMHMFTNNKNE